MENVLIEKMDHNGRGIARTDNKTIFVSNALPNEVVDIKITFEKKKIAEAEVIKYIKTSEDRINPKCPYYGKCGGCDLMHINYGNQLLYKESKVKEIIERYGNINCEIIKPIVGGEQYNYRNKITLHVKDKAGFYLKKSSKIITIENCDIADKKINEIIEKLNNINLDGIYEIVIRTSKNNLSTMLVLKLYNEIDNNEYINEFKDLVDTIVLYKKRQFETIYGNGYILEKLNNFNFKISPDSFFQVNTNQTIKLYDKVVEYADLNKNENVLDLFCGTGTIGIYLSSYCNKVLGVEINKYAIEDAKFNKKLNNINNIEFKCLDAIKINQVTDSFDVVIIDPPRTGLEKETIAYLNDLSPKKIVYVSCDAITLARDIKLLSEKYDVIEITPFDLFSNTEHVENVCKLVRK